MEDKVEKESPKKEEQGKEEEPMKEEQQSASTTTPKSGEGWGGWGFSAFFVLSNLQKLPFLLLGRSLAMYVHFFFLNIYLCIYSTYGICIFLYCFWY